MQITNPFQMNDWGIKKFLKVVLAIQFAMWGVIGLDATGLQIPILRQLIGFIYLIFVPGILILRILKLHKLGNIETLLYTVGLSITTLMFTGLFMNAGYPLFGISRPISITPLIITISVLVLILCVLCYIRDQDFSDQSYIDVKDVLSPPALFLCLIPFLSIFGTYLVNFYHNNILLMLMIVVIALVVLSIAFDKLIPKNLYPLAVFVIAISLLYHCSLISMYLFALGDIMCEYTLIKLVVTNLQWDPTIDFAINGMLGVVMFSPIFSEIAEMSIDWILKLVYPLLFSLVPVGLYEIYKKQTSDKIAFLSCFFFMSLFTFFSEMLGLPRQEIAEFFLVLLMLLMVNVMDPIRRPVLIIIFSFSLIVSHYGLSYIFMFSLIIGFVLLSLKVWEKKHDNRITPTFIILFAVSILSWYMYTASSASFDAIVKIGDHMITSIWTDFITLEGAQGMDIILEEAKSTLGSIQKALHLITQFFIAIGLLTTLLNKKRRFENEYIAFSIIFFGLLLTHIIAGFFTIGINTGRLYHIALLFLSPFCILGGVAILKGITTLKHALYTKQLFKKNSSSTSFQSKKTAFLLVLAVLIPLYLFNTGFIHTIAGEGTSLALDYSKNPHRFTRVNDIASARWLYLNTPDYRLIYICDEYGNTPFGYVTSFYEMYGPDRRFCTIYPHNIVKNGDYIHLRYGDISQGKIFYRAPEKSLRRWEIITLHNTTFVQHGNKIYDCGSVVYKMPYREI